MHASASVLELVVAAFGVAYASTVVLGGRLGDNHGRRRVLRIGLAWFGAGLGVVRPGPVRGPAGGRPGRAGAGSRRWSRRRCSRRSRPGPRGPPGRGRWRGSARWPASRPASRSSWAGPSSRPTRPGSAGARPSGSTYRWWPLPSSRCGGCRSRAPSIPHRVDVRRHGTAVGRGRPGRPAAHRGPRRRLAVVDVDDAGGVCPGARRPSGVGVEHGAPGPRPTRAAEPDPDPRDDERSHDGARSSSRSSADSCSCSHSPPRPRPAWTRWASAGR